MTREIIKFIRKNNNEKCFNHEVSNDIDIFEEYDVIEFEYNLYNLILNQIEEKN